MNPLFQKTLAQLADHPSYRHNHFPYIDFDGLEVPHTQNSTVDQTTYSGVNLTLVVNGNDLPYVYYVMGLNTPDGWDETIPPPDHHCQLIRGVNDLVDSFRARGIEVARILDQSAYPDEAITVTEGGNSTRTIVIVPSSEGEEGTLVFYSPENASNEKINALVDAAIRKANDDNSERSDEVIALLTHKGFIYIDGNKVLKTNPWI